jgi:hypothetical protein
MTIERDLRNVAGHIEGDWGDLTYIPTGQSVVKLLRESAARIRDLEAAIKEIRDGFVPSGEYCGRPIYEIVPPADGEVDAKGSR